MLADAPPALGMKTVTSFEFRSYPPAIDLQIQVAAGCLNQTVQIYLVAARDRLLLEDTIAAEAPSELRL